MFKKLLLALALSLSVAACNENRGSDGFVFETEQFDKDAVMVKFVTFDTVAAYREELKNRGLPYRRDEDVKTMAFATLHPPHFNTCTIYMVDLKVKYDPTFLGHELAHCKHGEWHPNATEMINKAVD